MRPSEAIARIRQHDGQLKAFVRVFDLPAGVRDEGPVFAVKDIFDVAGVHTGGGGRTALAPAAKAHAVAVARLMEAGWTLAGMTHTVELAFGSSGFNGVLGTPWNPWSPEDHRAPGGSSSGSAVAVAAGLCDGALGTDTAGSVRIPAALCGVVGLKPGQGLVSTRGVRSLCPGLDTVGVLAASVRTAARMLEVISGPDGGDALRGPFGAGTALAAGVAGMRIAAFPVAEIPAVHPGVAEAYGLVLGRLRDLGLAVAMVRPPGVLDASLNGNGVLIAAEAWRIWGARVLSRHDEMDPWIVRRFEMGAAISDERLAAAHRERAAHRVRLSKWMAGYDAFVLPTCPVPAPRLSELDETTSPLSRFTRLANYFDLPAITLPCGLTPEGLPVGLQIVAGPQDETGLVAIAAACEQVSGWNGLRPDLSRLRDHTPRVRPPSIRKAVHATKAQPAPRHQPARTSLGQ